jgi:transaldolase
LPQIIASAKATAEGIQMIQKDHRLNTSQAGVDLTKWRAVITMMVGRLTERKQLMEQAKRRGIEFTWADRHWFGIAVFQRAYRFIQDGGYPSKMLVCSMRQGPLVAGKPRFWDVEKLVGDVVFTCPPYVLEPLFEVGRDLSFDGGGIEAVEVPQSVLDKMARIPYCIQSYEPNGMPLEQFDTYPPTQYTIKAFSGAFQGLLDYVGGRMAKVRGTLH